MLSLLRLLSYAVAALAIIVGVLLIAGRLVATNPMPDELRITFGVVMLLFGVYRAVVTMAQHRESRRG